MSFFFFFYPRSTTTVEETKSPAHKFVRPFPLRRQSRSVSVSARYEEPAPEIKLPTTPKVEVPAVTEAFKKQIQYTRPAWLDAVEQQAVTAKEQADVLIAKANARKKERETQEAIAAELKRRQEADNEQSAMLMVLLELDMI